MMIGVKCDEVIGICFLCVILFNCKMPVHILFQIKFPQNRCLGTSPGSAGIRHIGAPNDLIVFIVFHQFGVIS